MKKTNYESYKSYDSRNQRGMETIDIGLPGTLQIDTLDEPFHATVDEPLHHPPAEPFENPVYRVTPVKRVTVQVPSRIEYTKTRRVSIKPQVLERHRIAALQDDATADAFRTLRTELLMQMQRNNWRTLAVTSAGKGAGKSTVALNLAMSFALELDHTALLVDADLREPDLRNLLGIKPGPGLSDYLLGKVALEDILLYPAIGNLVLLPGGGRVPNTSELMRSPRMASLVNELRTRYPDRLVVFDMPAILSGADALAFSSYIDATILVVEERRTKPEEITRACALMSHANLIGVVLNKSRELPAPASMTESDPGMFQRVFGATG